jgi:tRNA dimethylallyltransferase
MNRLIAIVGPTAVGKSALALRMAQAFGGEIVSADSRQVYRYMDIGTAKPSPAERALVPHHLVDIVDPDQDFTLALYQGMASSTIEDIQRRGRLVFLVGGSGLYVKSIADGLSIPRVAPDAGLRRTLEEKATVEGHMSLYNELNRVDTAAANEIDPRNVRRVIRALEVYYATGTPFSSHQKNLPAFQTLTIGLTTDRDNLYGKIDSRVDDMIQRGLIDEVKGLMRRGYSLDLPAMSSLGYKQIGQYINGELELEEAAQRIKYDTHRFARHQYAWFRPGDESIHWFNVKDEANNYDDIQGLIASHTGIRPTKQLSGMKK